MDKMILSASPGIIEFSNFEKIKSQLSAYIENFDDRDYEKLGYDFALADKNELSKVKKFFSKKRLGLKKVYTDPFVQVEQMFKELESIVDTALKPAKDYVDSADKDVKKKSIMAYASDRAVELGEHGSKIVNSSAFFNDRWLNKSFKQKDIIKEINSKLSEAKEDLQKIKELPIDNKEVLVARYYETLSMDGLGEFNKNLSEVKKHMELNEYDNRQEKILKIRATKLQYYRLFDFMNSEGIDYKEID